MKKLTYFLMKEWNVSSIVNILIERCLKLYIDNPIKIITEFNVNNTPVNEISEKLLLNNKNKKLKL